MTKEIDLEYFFEADAKYNGPRCQDCEHWKPSEAVKVPGFAHCDALRDTCGMVIRSGESWAKHCMHYEAKYRRSSDDDRIIAQLKEVVHNTSMIHDLSKQAVADAEAGDWRGCLDKLSAMSSVHIFSKKQYGKTLMLQHIANKVYPQNPKDPVA